MKKSLLQSRQIMHGIKTAHRRKVIAVNYYLRHCSMSSSSFLILFLDKFYSSSDSDSEDEIERKIHVEIKPLNNGTDKISASVDELRATVENLSLSPIGVLSVINFAFFRVLLMMLYRFSLKKSRKASFFMKNNLLVSVSH